MTQAARYLEEMFPVWNKLEPSQREILANAASMRRFTKGSPLHSGSDDCTGLFMVVSGQLRVFLISESGKEITLYRLFERDMCLFSASCMINSLQFDIYVDAEKDTDTVLIPTQVYQQLMEVSMPVQRYTSELMASRFSDVMWLVEQTLFKSFDVRLAAFLNEQRSIEASDTLHITHEEIARHMGTVREVVTRMLKYFQSEGAVSLFRGGIKIENHKKLEAMM